MGKEFTFRVIRRMVEAGLPVSRACNFFGVSTGAVYYRGTPKRKLKKKKKRKINFDLLEEAERLIYEGYPADVVAYLSGIPLSVLLDYLAEEEAGQSGASGLPLPSNKKIRRYHYAK
ncbi:hypothetical protein Thein_1977 [Thermodesulfatator indicus DSM 15286]|uniref:Transposase n=1 Tax=Thermodesulfatator indicus (strain DSM 15286 / JCM 11887 / CIR29812) TaxID=667014 RepID=F8ACQ2_THEID|nr:hypothetical protein [Thermodesulfatator indicus]AEH45831.1 hypothetical protein Thein_1977 [Thermodesulfatator indicus DSM 15286]